MNKLSCTTLLALVIASTGCFTVNADLPGTLRNDVTSADTETLGQLSIEKGHWFYIAGLVGAPDKDFLAPEITKAVQAKGGDGVANLRYEASEGCVDMIIGGCTGGCIYPRSYKVTGDIVRIKKAPLPGKPAKVSALETPQPEQVATAQQF